MSQIGMWRFEHVLYPHDPYKRAENVIGYITELRQLSTVYQCLRLPAPSVIVSDERIVVPRDWPWG